MERLRERGEPPTRLPHRQAGGPRPQLPQCYVLGVVYVNATAEDNDQAEGQQDGQGEVPALQLS